MLKDNINGPDWLLRAGVILFTILAIILITGHGSGFIAGYNDATKEEKAKYDENKLCRIVGVGMAVIALVLAIMAIGENVLPESVVYAALVIVMIDCITVIILCSTLGRKKLK